GLIVAGDLERHRLGEVILRPAIEADVLVARQREFDDEDHAGRAARRVGRRADHAIDPRIGQQRDVIACRLLGLAVKPQTWRGLLFHGQLLLAGTSASAVWRLDTLMLPQVRRLRPTDSTLPRTSRPVRGLVRRA